MHQDIHLKGKKKNLTRGIQVDYYGKEICELTSKSIETVLGTISSSIRKWKELIDISFLSKEMESKYNELPDARLNILNIQNGR